MTNLREGPLGESVTPEIAENRARELLMALVPAENWGVEITPRSIGFECTCPECSRGIEYEYFDVVGNISGDTYRVRAHSYSGNVRRLISVSGAQVGKAFCGYPWPLHDYVDPNSLHVLRDHQLYMRRNRSGVMVQLPTSDLLLGQYLTLKYNEQEFLDHAYG